MMTINYKIPGWELDEHLGVRGCKNDVMLMFATHGDFREIMFYITYTEAKCVSMDDRGVADDSHGHDEGMECDDDVYDHHGVDDGEFEDLYDDGEDYEDDVGDHEGSDDDGGDHDNVDHVGGDDQGVDKMGVQDGGDANLFDYEPISEYDSPRDRGNTRDFDFSNPRFRVGMVFAIVKEFRQALRQYCVVEDIEIKRKKNEKSRFTRVCSTVDCGWR
uniref:Transposase MuDR plant domain-containing protein n=1 Tax=Nelumbo nucifera TaxID=4432 RepID=A0A822XP64_NELNU|nr:TPA_asm: hypothetical protein HUJ06_022946 [Nelumbo nucifera]